MVEKLGDQLMEEGQAQPPMKDKSQAKSVYSQVKSVKCKGESV